MNLLIPPILNRRKLSMSRTETLSQMLPCNVCHDPVNSRTNYSPSQKYRSLPMVYMSPVKEKKGTVFFSWTVLFLVINHFLPQQACHDNHIKGLILNLLIESTSVGFFIKVVIYSATVTTFLPCSKAAFPILSERCFTSGGNILWAGSSQVHHTDLVLKTLYSTTVSAWTCFFLFRYSEHWAEKSAIFLQ